MRRQYHFCAKCGMRTLFGPGEYVCVICQTRRGRFNFCAVCGAQWDEGESRDYVCYDDLAQKVPVA